MKTSQFFTNAAILQHLRARSHLDNISFPSANFPYPRIPPRFLPIPIIKLEEADPLLETSALPLPIVKSEMSSWTTQLAQPDDNRRTTFLFFLPSPSFSRTISPSSSFSSQPEANEVISFLVRSRHQLHVTGTSISSPRFKGKTFDPSLLFPCSFLLASSINCLEGEGKASNID